MKKTIVALAILLTCMGFIPSDAANWYWIGADSSGNQWYIDNQSASKSYDVAVVWVKTVREDGTYNLCQWEITRDRKMAILQATVYNADHEPISSYSADSWQKKYHAVTPDSMGEAIYDSVWQKQGLRYGQIWERKFGGVCLASFGERLIQENQPIAGALGDRWGDKRYMSFGEIGFSKKILSR